LPTAVEQGFPTVVAQQLIGLIAPAGTPPAIIAQVARAVRTAVADTAFQQTLREAGVEPDPESMPETFRAVAPNAQVQPPLHLRYRHSDQPLEVGWAIVRPAP